MLAMQFAMNDYCWPMLHHSTTPVDVIVVVAVPDLISTIDHGRSEAPVNHIVDRSPLPVGND